MEKLTPEKLEELKKYHEYKLKQAENNVIFHKDKLKQIEDKKEVEEPKTEDVEVNPYERLLD